MEEWRRFFGDSTECHAVAFLQSPGEAGPLLLAAGFLNGVIVVWDVESGELITRWKAHEVGIINLFSLRTGELWSHGRDGWCYRWELPEVDDLAAGGPPKSPTHVLCIGYASFCRMSGLSLTPSSPPPATASLSSASASSPLRELLVGAALRTEDLEVWEATDKGKTRMLCKVEASRLTADKRGMATATQLLQLPAMTTGAAGAAGLSSSVFLAASYESGTLDIRDLSPFLSGPSLEGLPEGQPELVLSVKGVSSTPILSFSINTDVTRALVASADASVAIVALDLSNREGGAVSGSVLRRVVLPCKGSLYLTATLTRASHMGVVGGRDGALRLLNLNTGEDEGAELSASDASSAGSISALAQCSCDAAAELAPGEAIVAAGYKNAPVTLWRVAI